MKWAPLLVLVFASLGSALRPWHKDIIFRYNLNVRTFTDSPESKDKWSGAVLRTHLTIQPQSDNVLNAQLSQVEYADVEDLEYDDITGARLTEQDLKYNERTDMQKPFQIHLKNGEISRLLVDNSMADYEIDSLKVLLSPLQINTNAKHFIREEDNHATYKVMDSTASGNCETLYDVTTVTDNLGKSDTSSTDDPKFIKISKVRRSDDYCVEKGNIEDVSTDDKKEKSKVTEENGEVGTVILSGSSQRYTIQSATTTLTTVVDDKKSIYKNVNITLESADLADASANNAQIQYAPNTLKDAGSLVLSDHTPSLEDMPDVVMSSDTPLHADSNMEYKWTNCYWTAGPNYACQNDLGPEFEWSYGDKKSCDIFRTAYLCKKSFPGCVQSKCYSVFAYPPATFCDKQFGSDYYEAGQCVFHNGCFSGFSRNRCCPRRR